jgi:ABC-type transporter Mla MlaB component
LLITLTGPLSVADLRRLEDACAPALASDPLAVELRLRDVTRVDAAAAAFLDRLARRGAVIVRSVPKVNIDDADVERRCDATTHTVRWKRPSLRRSLKHRP